MIDIPDDVVERVKTILRLFHRDSCYPEAMDFELDEATRAAGRVFVEWERQNCNEIIRKCWGEESEIYAKFRSRSTGREG